MFQSTLLLAAFASIAFAQSTVYVQPVPAPTATGLSCPESNSTVYTAPSGDQYVIECDIDHAAGDLLYKEVETFEECILACEATEGCVDVSLSGVACYLKSTVGATSIRNGIWGARLIVSASSVDAPASTSGIQSVSCPANNGSTYIAESYARFVVECGYEHAAGDMAMQYVDDLTDCINLCDSTDGCIDVSLSGSACYLKSSVGAVTYSEGISSAKRVSVGPQCPLPEGSDGTYTAENGQQFALECDIDHPGGDSSAHFLTGVTGVAFFGDCIELCSTEPGCIDLSLSGAGCYLKDTLYPSATATGILGARLISPPTSTPSASSTPAPTPSAVSPVDVGSFEYVACYNDSVSARVLSSGFLYGSAPANSMTAEKCAEYCDDYTYFGLEYSQECYCGGVLLNNPVEMPNGCGMVCAGNGTQICGGDGALSLYRKLGSEEPALNSSTVSSSAVSSSSTVVAETSSSVEVPVSSSVSMMPTLTSASSSVSLMPSLTTGTGTYPTSTENTNGTLGNSTENTNGTLGNSTTENTNATRRVRRGPRLGPVRLDLNYRI